MHLYNLFFILDLSFPEKIDLSQIIHSIGCEILKCYIPILGLGIGNSLGKYLIPKFAFGSKSLSKIFKLELAREVGGSLYSSSLFPKYHNVSQK